MKGKIMLEQVSKKYVLTKDLVCLCVWLWVGFLLFCGGFLLFSFLFLSPAACLKPMRDCALFDSYSEPLPSSQQARDFSRTEVRRGKLSPSLAERRGLDQLHETVLCEQQDCGSLRGLRESLRLSLSNFKPPALPFLLCTERADRLFKR